MMMNARFTCVAALAFAGLAALAAWHVAEAAEDQPGVALLHSFEDLAAADRALAPVAVERDGDVERRYGPMGPYAWFGSNGRMVYRPVGGFSPKAGTVAFWLYLTRWQMMGELPGRFARLCTADGRASISLERGYNSKELGVVVLNGDRRFQMGEWQGFCLPEDGWLHVAVSWDSAGSGAAWPKGRIDLYLNGRLARRFYAELPVEGAFETLELGGAADMQCGVARLVMLRRDVDAAGARLLQDAAPERAREMEEQLALAWEARQRSAETRRAEQWSKARAEGVVIEAERHARSSGPLRTIRFEGDHGRGWGHYWAATASDSECLSAFGKGGWAEWEFEAPAAGRYAIGLRLQRARSVGRPFSEWELTLDGQPLRQGLETVAIPATGTPGDLFYPGDVPQFKDFAVADGETFALAKGKHVLRITKRHEYLEALDQIVVTPAQISNVSPIEFLDGYEPMPSMIVKRVERRTVEDGVEAVYELDFRGESRLKLDCEVATATADPLIRRVAVDRDRLVLGHRAHGALQVRVLLPASAADGRSRTAEVLLTAADIPVTRRYKLHVRIPQGEPRQRPAFWKSEPREQAVVEAVRQWRKARRGPCPDHALNRLLEGAESSLEMDLDAYLPREPVIFAAGGHYAALPHMKCQREDCPFRDFLKKGGNTDDLTSEPRCCAQTPFASMQLRGWRLMRVMQKSSTYGGGELLLTWARAYDATREERFARKAREAFLALADRFPRYVYCRSFGCGEEDPLLGREDLPGRVMNTCRLGVGGWLAESWAFREVVMPAYDLVASSACFTQEDRDFIENNLLWAMDDDILMESGGTHALGGNQPNEGVAFTRLGLTTGDSAIVDHVKDRLQHLPDLTEDGVPWQKTITWAYTGSFYDFVDLCRMLRESGVDVRNNATLRKVLAVFPLMGFRDGQLPQMGVGGELYSGRTFYESPPDTGLRVQKHLSGRVYEGLKLGEELWGGEFARFREYADARQKGAYPPDWRLPSVNFEDTGLAMLRGTGENPMEVFFSYLRRRDAESLSCFLTFFLYGNGEILSYVPIADDWPGGRYASPYAWGYARGAHATVCKNFVNLDERGTSLTPCQFVHWEDSPDLKVIWGASEGYYPGVRGERTLLLAGKYLVDFFRCASDAEHTMDWQFHSVGRLALPDDVELRPQEKPLVEARLGTGGGYEFLRQIRRAQARGVTRAEWTVTPENRLRAFVAALPGDEWIAAKLPMFYDDKERIKHEPERFTHCAEHPGDHMVDALLHRAKAKRRVFAAVYEAYGKGGSAPAVKDVRIVDPDGLRSGDSAIIEVVHEGGTDLFAVNYERAFLKVGQLETDARLCAVLAGRGAYVYDASRAAWQGHMTQSKTPVTLWMRPAQ